MADPERQEHPLAQAARQEAWRRAQPPARPLAALRLAGQLAWIVLLPTAIGIAVGTWCVPPAAAPHWRLGLGVAGLVVGWLLLVRRLLRLAHGDGQEQPPAPSATRPTPHASSPRSPHAPP